MSLSMLIPKDRLLYGNHLIDLTESVRLEYRQKFGGLLPLRKFDDLDFILRLWLVLLVYEV
jgi:hypothetical protein